jgi:predicted RNase H-like nuclease (RuvC/YqgF family)
MRHSAKKALSEACKNSNILSGFPTSNSQSTVSSNFSQIQKNQREEDMKIKVQDMEVQIDNKNETIFRLQQEI